MRFVIPSDAAVAFLHTSLCPIVQRVQEDLTRVSARITAFNDGACTHTSTNLLRLNAVVFFLGGG